MKHAETNTVRHQIGTCPACRVGIYADVDIETHVGKPSLSVDGRSALVFVDPRIVATRLEHDCDKRIDDEPAQPADERPADE
jgi:hypothetical protein